MVLREGSFCADLVLIWSVPWGGEVKTLPPPPPHPPFAFLLCSLDWPSFSACPDPCISPTPTQRLLNQEHTTLCVGWRRGRGEEVGGEGGRERGEKVQTSLHPHRHHVPFFKFRFLSLRLLLLFFSFFPLFFFWVRFHPLSSHPRFGGGGGGAEAEQSLSCQILVLLDK